MTRTSILEPVSWFPHFLGGNYILPIPASIDHAEGSPGMFNAVDRVPGFRVLGI